MRLSISKTKNAASLYVIESVTKNGRRTSRVVESLGTMAELKEKLNGEDPVAWAKQYIGELNRKEKESKREVLVRYSPAKQIPKGEKRLHNGGYLFLQKIYHELSIDKICAAITEKYKFTFDMNSILSRLVYGRVIYPASKLSTYQLSEKFMEPRNFEIQHIYRALEVIAKENDFIQAELYKNSIKQYKRNAGVIYYDCTNYYFEIEQSDGLKQYGYSKEHKPNPIVGMGLFMDADGIPLSFAIHKGNANEQITMKPLERKILSDFNLSKMVVCTDAGLASYGNREFNNMGGRAFITTQSIKILKGHIMGWALNSKGWHLPGEKKSYDIAELDSCRDRENVYYKETWINENGLEQRLIVTYSIKYRDYQRKIRDNQIERARKLIETNPKKVKKAHQNDFKRFIGRTSVTEHGEVADKEIYSINADAIAAEEVFDGFYGVCTNLEDDASAIVKINSRRWEIEECFRIMKTDFKARPVYLSRDDRIEAHFVTCFIALLLYRFLEKKTGEKYTCPEIVNCLRDMNFYKTKDEDYVPAYTRTDLTDSLHDAFGFRTDYEIVTQKNMKKIQKTTKSR